MIKVKILTLIVAASALSACASNNKKVCAPGEISPGCASMGETYDAAIGGGGSKGNVFDNSAHIDGKKVVSNPLNMQSGQHQVAGPVFHPPKPYRVGIAPWTDANGLMHSGEYVYFTTPGRWSYGPMQLPGSAAGLIAPIKPDDLGFSVRDSMDPNQPNRQSDGVVMPDRNFGPQGLR